MSQYNDLSINTCLAILLNLLECYEQPALVLDALDECSKESRALVLADLHSILNISSRPVKVFISSRYSLDIEDCLRNFQHVYIQEHLVNSEDIDDYMKRELWLLIQNGHLLRGKFLPKLGQPEITQKTLLNRR